MPTAHARSILPREGSHLMRAPQRFLPRHAFPDCWSVDLASPVIGAGCLAGRQARYAAGRRDQRGALDVVIVFGGAFGWTPVTSVEGAGTGRLC